MSALRRFIGDGATFRSELCARVNRLAWWEDFSFCFLLRLKPHPKNGKEISSNEWKFHYARVNPRIGSKVWTSFPIVSAETTDDDSINHPQFRVDFFCKFLRLPLQRRFIDRRQRLEWKSCSNRYSLVKLSISVHWWVIRACFVDWWKLLHLSHRADRRAHLHRVKRWNWQTQRHHCAIT